MARKKTIRVDLLVAATLLLCLTSARKGWAQTAAQTGPTPQQIDDYLSQKHTTSKPLAQLGDEFVSLGSQYQVDPRLVVAISGAESSFGAHVCTQANAWNWFWEGPCPKSPFDSWESGVKTVTHFMHKSYLLKGYNTIPLIGAKYCASGCQFWVPNVTEFFSELGGDVNNLAWSPNGIPLPPPVPLPATPQGPPAPTIVADLISSKVNPGHWWHNSSSATVEVQATVAGAIPVARSVKLVRTSGQELQDVAVLHMEGVDTNGNAVFVGQATVDEISSGSLDLQVKAAFPKNAKVAAAAASNVISLTTPAASSRLPLLLALIGGLVVLLVGGTVLAIRFRKPKAAVQPIKRAA